MKNPGNPRGNWFNSPPDRIPQFHRRWVNYLPKQRTEIEVFEGRCMHLARQAGWVRRAGITRGYDDTSVHHAALPGKRSFRADAQRLSGCLSKEQQWRGLREENEVHPREARIAPPGARCWRRQHVPSPNRRAER